MNKQQFFKILKKEISGLSKEEQINAIEFYEEHFNERNNDEEVIKSLPHPTIIADDLYRELGIIRQVRMTHSTLEIAIMTLLCIFVGPFILGFLIIAFSFVVIVPVSLTLSFGFTAFGALFGTIAGVFYNFQTVVSMIGMFILSIGLMMLFIKITLKGSNWFAKLSKNIINYLKGYYYAK